MCLKTRGWGLSRRLSVVALASLLAAGCSDAGRSNALLVDYQRELASRLGVEAPEPQPPNNIGAFPERRERLLEIPETREGMLNVYALRECHITTLVAERNSTLGRVAPASQRWRYELELWRRLDTCLAGDIPERLAEADLERLERLAEIKTDQLPAASWNALFDSDEWTKSFSRVSSTLPPDEVPPPSAQREALAFLHDLVLHLFKPEQQPDIEALESHLQALRSRPYTAELLRTLLLAEQRLDEASALLKPALTRHDGCTGQAAGLNEAKSTVKLDAWLSSLEQAAQDWLGDLERLLEGLPPGTESVRDYRRNWLSLDAPGAPLPAFLEARERHENLRERLFERCR